MSTYGQATSVVIQPYVATQAFRDSLREILPCTIVDIAAATASRAGLDGLLAELHSSGPLGVEELLTARSAIGVAKRMEVVNGAVSSLVAMGYSVSAINNDTSAIWAERGHEVVALEVVDGGGFESDRAGLDNADCLRGVEEFEAQMAERGITFAHRQHTHNDPRGGQLIRRVERARDAAPEAARPARARATGRPARG